MKVNKKYLPVITRMLSNKGARYIILTGGRGGGKTHLLLNSLILRMKKNYGDVGLLSKYTFKGAYNGLLPSLKSAVFNLQNAVITNSYLKYGNNSYIIDGIKTAYGSKLKSIEKFSFWWCDEAQDIQKQQEFDDIDKSIRGGNDSLTVLSLNPTSKLHWIYQYFFKNVDYQEIKVNNEAFYVPIIQDSHVIHVHSSYLDVIEFLDDSFLSGAKRIFDIDKRMYAKIYLGLFEENTDDTVFRFECNEYVDYSLPSLIGVDFGYYPDPSAIVKVWVDNDNKIIYARVLLYERRLKINELKEYFSMDETYICDTNIKNFTEELRAEGYNIFYKNQKISLREQVETIRQYKIVTNSQALLNELNGYCEDEKKTYIAAEGDHAIDAMRYTAFELIK